MTTNTMNGFYVDVPEVTIDQQGEGRPVLLLHGGGGPPSMGPLPSALSEDFQVIAPVHPGFARTPRPEWYTGIDDIALSYLQLLEQRDLHDVLAGHLPHLEQPQQVLEAIHRLAASFEPPGAVGRALLDGSTSILGRVPGRSRS